VKSIGPEIQAILPEITAALKTLPKQHLRHIWRDAFNLDTPICE